MWEIHKSGSARGVKLFYKAEYCGTPQSKERRNGEYKVCLNNRALRLLDHGFAEEFKHFATHEKGVLWYSLLLKCFSQDAWISCALKQSYVAVQEVYTYSSRIEIS